MKFKRTLSAALALAMAFSMAACAANNTTSGAASGTGSTASAAKEEEITFVLDWTPNTNHTGLYVAEKLGYFKEAGLKVNIVQPPEGGASSLVGAGKAQFGIDCQDTMTPALIGESAVPVTAVAALIQHNTSGIISLKGKGMDRPKGMEGHSYNTWDMPVEQAMIKYVVEKDGGDYSKINMIPTTATDEVTALQTSTDSIWVFYAWAGIATKVKGLETDFFAFKDIDPVFDYYTPVIVANNDYLKNNAATAKKFLEAVKKGYEYAIANPDAAANILLEAVPELKADTELVTESQKWISAKYKEDVAQWGYINPSRWDAFYKWLYDNQLIDTAIPAGMGFTNDYLSK